MLNANYSGRTSIKIYFQIILTILFITWFSGNAGAACLFKGQNYYTENYSLADSAFPRDKVVGNYSTTELYPSQTFVLACAGGNYGTTTATVSDGQLSSGYTDVYQTGIPGIGIRFQLTPIGLTSSGTTFRTAPFATTTGSTTLATAIFNVKIDLVVTGTVQSGTATSLPTLSVKHQAYGSSGYTSYTLVLNPFTITAMTCQVSTSNISVPMATMTQGNFSEVNTVAGTRNFSIGLNSCPAGANIYVTLSDVSSPSNTSNILSLSADSTATGVAYQILYNSEPVNFGPSSSSAGTLNQWWFGQSTAGSMTIPLSARYIKTSESIGLGTVNALATFTLSYQ